MSDLGIALSKVLFEYEPKLLDCDVDAFARATADVANLLGCVMASTLIVTPSDYERILVAVIKIIDESAKKTANMAVNMAPNLTPH